MQQYFVRKLKEKDTNEQRIVISMRWMIAAQLTYKFIGICALIFIIVANNL